MTTREEFSERLEDYGDAYMRRQEARSISIDSWAREAQEQMDVIEDALLAAYDAQATRIAELEADRDHWRNLVDDLEHNIETAMLTCKEFEMLVNDLVACERSVDWYNLHGTFDDSEERAIKRRDIARAKLFAVFEPLEQAVYIESLAHRLNDQLMECSATREMYRIRCDDLYKAGMERITELKDALRELATCSDDGAYHSMQDCDVERPGNCKLCDAIRTARLILKDGKR